MRKHIRTDAVNTNMFERTFLTPDWAHLPANPRPHMIPNNNLRILKTPLYYTFKHLNNSIFTEYGHRKLIELSFHQVLKAVLQNNVVGRVRVI